MPTPAPSEEKTSNLLWWLLGLMLVALGILLIGAMVIARVFQANVEVARTASQVETFPPADEYRPTRPAVVDPDLPVFPGAENFEPGTSIEISPPAEDPVIVTVARYRTQARLPQVDAWYQEQLGGEFIREGPGQMNRKGRIFGTEVRSDDTVFLSEAEDEMRAVSLRRQGLYTEIALIRITREPGAL